MNIVKAFNTSISKRLVSVASFTLALATAHSASALNLAQSPLFMITPVKPIVMLNLSNDHQLYFKAYDDYSDLNGDGTIDTSYINDYDYYGYFDEDRCYDYGGGTFTPAGFSSNHYCTGNWSGNFLNWATTTRMDAVRKILYGGKRSTDTVSKTVLERALLPQDAHSFTKFYEGSDLHRLTSFNSSSGITMCNTTDPSNRVQSQQVDTANAPPLMRVVKGNYALWASNEGWQCRPGLGSNGNDVSITGMDANPSSPSSELVTDYVVRVEVCSDSDVGDNNENCKAYPSGKLKPTGLLQKYGEDDTLHFGLFTGSYSKNKSGGVLRKNVGSVTDEVDTDNGVFTEPTTGGKGIIGTINRLRISRYNYSNGQYNSSDNCPWGLSSFGNGRCTNWGNPQSEMYLESLRYLAGLNPVFATDDSSNIPGLSTVTWQDPIGEENFCAPLSVIQFNASSSSYDGDELSGFGDVQRGAGLDSLTNKIGSAHGLDSGTYFYGGSDELCTPKSIASLSSVTGICPDAPRLEGSYQIAGMAYSAHLNGIAEGRETVTTFGVTLAPAVPQVILPTPAGSSVTIMPACRSNTTNGNCAIVDMKVVDQTSTSGTLYINWEDSEQGGDFDQDMWGVLKYKMSQGEIEITTQVVAMSTNHSMGFGYTISGVDKPGFHVHSGINNFTYESTAYPELDSCTSGGQPDTGSNCSCRAGNYSTSNFYNGTCNSSVRERSQTFKLDSDQSAESLEQPLYYAATWGGFDKAEENGVATIEAPDVNATPRTYFEAREPRKLAEELDAALLIVAQGDGAAASVATNSTRLGSDTFLYQATFNSISWHGDLKAFAIDTEANIDETPAWSASQNISPSNAASRKIYTYNPDSEKGVFFDYANLSAEQKSVLDGSDGYGADRVKWTKGYDVSLMREREAGEYLGDIVNSNPAFFGTKDYQFAKYEEGAPGYEAFVESKSGGMIYVGANDGMLHAFNAEANGAEQFAYIPSSVYQQLHSMTFSDYGNASSNPHVYSVDGQVYVGDAYWGGQWRTILVGALAGGGKGLYVLDVTDPTSFGPDDILFEITPDTVASNGEHIGHIYGQPVIAPLSDSEWVIIAGNGYNSTSGKAGLLVIDDTGSVEFIEASATGGNGLAEPALRLNAEYFVIDAYAGDLYGNLWKFDVQNRKLAAGNPFFKAVDSGGSAQPITASPVLGINTQKRDDEGTAATMVYFGTGKYIEVSDISTTAEQSFYGLADSGGALERDDLYTPENTIAQSGSTRSVNEAQDNGDLDWKSEDGWVVDFDTELGERVVVKPQLLFDRLLFPTVVPDPAACEFGGTSWIMALTGVGGIYDNYDMLPHDGLQQDTLVSLSNLILGENSSGEGTIVVQKSDGEKYGLDVPPPAPTFGRQSWRQLQ